MSVSELFCGAVGFVSISKGDETIAVAILMHCRLVNDPHRPHKTMVATATEALATSHFHLADGGAGSFEDQSAISVLESFQGRVASHYRRMPPRETAMTRLLLGCTPVEFLKMRRDFLRESLRRLIGWFLVCEGAKFRHVAGLL